MDKNILIKKIALEGKKISDLELTEYISGEELIEITQDHKSKAVSIDTILESANTGVIKIPRRDITLDKAISLVKDSQKSFGAILHFHNGETDSWEMYRYNNPSIKDFDDTSNWEYINISNNFKGLFPTEKDLLARFPRPSLNDYALVGTTMESADTYYATTPNTWSKTTNKLNKKLCKYKGITSRDANVKVVCTPIPASKSCSRPYRRGNSVYWRLDDGTEEWLFDVTDDINLICPETPDEEMYDVFVETTEGGTFTPQPVITPVPFNTTINLTAIPEEGYEFKHWKVGNSTHTTPELTVKVTDDVVIIGIFEKKEVPLPPTPPAPQPKPKYTIKSRAVNGGITVPSSITVEEGTEVEIGAFVPENKLFKHWTLNNQVVGTNNTIKVIADGNKEYVAIIEDKPTPKPDPVPEPPKPEPTPPAPKPTPVITYDIEADTTPVSITIDDTTQEREVCFSYKVVKNTTLEGNTTKEYVSNYTSNRAKDRFCVTTSTNKQLPLEVNVDGTVLNKTFTINVTDNRTPDRGFFEVDYPNSTGIEATPEGPRLINQCYTDGTGGIVTYTIKLTERSNPFVGIPENLPQGIEVTLSEDKKTMTIKTICNVISNAVGKIFDVFDFFKRMISVLIGSFQEPAPIHPEYITVTLRKRYSSGSPLQNTEEKIQVPYGGTFTPEMPEVEDHWREKIASDLPGREHEIYLTHPDYRPTPFTNLTSDITVVLDYVYEDPNTDVEQPQTQYNVRYNLTYSFIDYDNSTPINVQGLPTEKEITGVTDLEDGPIYYTVEVPEVPGYKFVEFIVEGGTPITMLPYSTNIWNDTNITFKYVKLATDSYGKPLPFNFYPAIINVLHYHYTPTVGNPTGTYMYSTTTFGLVVDRPGAVTSSTNLVESARAKNEYPIRIADNANGVSLDNIEYSVFPTEYSYNQNKPYDSELYMYVGSPKYNYGNSDGDYNNKITAAKESTFDSVMDAKSIAETYDTFNRYEPKELTVTLSSGVYKFKPEDITELNVAVHAAPHDGYRKGRQVNETEDLLYAVVHRDIYTTYTPYVSQPVPAEPASPSEDEETPTPQPPTTSDTTPPAEEGTTDYSIYVGKPAIVLNGSNNGDYGPFNYTIAYNGVEQNIQSITWDIPSLGINSGELTNNSGFSFSFSVNYRLIENTLDVHQDVRFDNAKNFAETYTLTANAMFGYE